MIDLYYWPTPNGWKVSIMLEEAGVPYSVKYVNIGAGDQFKPDFLKISPNNRMPAIVDHEPMGGGAPISIFESGAILEYLADKRVASTRCFNGFTGRWAVSAQWRGKTTTSICMRPKNSRMRSTATLRKPTASME